MKLKSAFLILTALLSFSASAIDFMPLICTISDGNYEWRNLQIQIRQIEINGETLKIPVVKDASFVLYQTKKTCKWESPRNTLPIPDSVGGPVATVFIAGSTIYGGNGSTIGGAPGLVTVTGFDLQPKKKYRFQVNETGYFDLAHSKAELVP